LFYKRALIADFDSHSRELIRILLEHEGCEVFEAVDGVQAVDIARATRPDLVLLDLALPRLNARDAARQMRGDARLKIRTIVALTGGATGDGDGLEDAGFSGQIAKPVVLRTLRQQFTEWDRVAID
jgi:CheY-like chemotaxis protein